MTRLAPCNCSYFWNLSCNFFFFFFFFFFLFQATLLQLGIFVVVKYMHHRDDLVEHRTREASFGAQYTNHSANSIFAWRIKQQVRARFTRMVDKKELFPLFIQVMQVYTGCS